MSESWVAALHPRSPPGELPPLGGCQERQFLCVPQAFFICHLGPASAASVVGCQGPTSLSTVLFLFTKGKREVLSFTVEGDDFTPDPSPLAVSTLSGGQTSG